MSSYFPLFFDMQGRNIRVFGGGRIAARRVKILLEFGSNVRVTAPEIAKELEELAEQKKQLLLDYKRYRPGELKDEELVFAATDDVHINLEIYEECRQKHILVNVASDQKKCDFYFPAIIRDEDITIGVASGGKDHRKVAEVARQIRSRFSQ